MQKIYIFFFLITSLVITSCTTTIYDNLDELILYYVDDYVTLTNEQEEEFESNLENFLQKHKVESLPTVHALLEEIKKEINTTLTVQQIENFRTSHEAKRDEFIHKTIDEFVPFITKLSNEQLDEINKNILEQIQEREEERAEEREGLSEKQIFEDHLEHRIEEFEERFDYITPQQEELLKNYLNTNRWNRELFRKNREKYMRQILSFLKIEKDNEKLKAQFYQWLKFPENLMLAEYPAYREARLKKRHEYMAKMGQLLEKEQKQILIEEIEEYQEIIQAVIEDASEN